MKKHSVRAAVEKGLVIAAHHIHPRFGEWLAHSRGWVRFVNERAVHDHAPSCPGADIEVLMRAHGFVKRCRTCGMPVEIKFSCWEEPDGTMPAEVVTWLVEEIGAVADLALRKAT